MDSEYNIFECLADGSVVWREDVSGLIKARRQLNALAQEGEFFAIQLPTRQILFPVAAPAIGKRVFQIAYTEKLCKERAEVLRRRGYGVLSVIGNKAAVTLLSTIQLRSADITLFVVGHAAPEAARKEMVAWLRQNYPNVKILVLNPPHQRIAAADYNVLQNGHELWLPLLSSLA